MAFVNAGGMPALTKAVLDSQMNSIIQNLDGVMGEIQAMEAFFTAHPDTDFTAVTGPGPVGYAAGDVTNFKSAFSDLDQLRTIYQGSATLGTAKDFRTFAKLIATLVH